MKFLRFCFFQDEDELFSKIMFCFCFFYLVWRATLLKKRLCHRYFPVDFEKFLRKLFLKEHLSWLLLPYMWSLARSFQKYSKHFLENVWTAEFADAMIIRWDKVFKNGPSKICGRQHLKNLKGYGLLRADYTPSNF